MRAWAILMLLALAAPAAALPVRPGYARGDGACGGFPRAPIEMAQGMCAGIVFAPPPAGLKPSKRGLRLPRALLALSDTELLVTDLGSWEPGHGAVWRLTVPSGEPARLQKVLDRLDLPHTIAVGPDGRTYVGEMSRIIRFDPSAADPGATVEVVVSGLPHNRLHDNRHPLSAFIFDADGALLVNVGAATDQCAADAASRVCGETRETPPRAAIWRYAYRGDGRWSERPEALATGLRNSVALARHPSGLILQGENSIDVKDADFPYDEINAIAAGSDYGWPYCVDFAARAPAWKGGGGPDCAGPKHVKPVLLLPPHGAPLALAYYQGPMFPRLQGRLLVTLHGYRAAGARIVAYEVDDSGRPTTEPHPAYALYGKGGAVTRKAYRASREHSAAAADGLILTPGWQAIAGRRPAGSPVGLAITPDGAIWVAEDKNGAILRIARDRP